jgi:hypothetical protein
VILTKGQGAMINVKHGFSSFLVMDEFPLDLVKLVIFDIDMIDFASLVLTCSRYFLQLVSWELAF